MPRVARLVSVVLLALVATATTARAERIALILGGEPAKQPVIESALAPWLKQQGFEVKLRVDDATIPGKLVDCFILNDQACGEKLVGKLGMDRTLFVNVEVHHDPKSKTDEVKLSGWLFAGGKLDASLSVPCRACSNATLGPTAEGLVKDLLAIAGGGAGRIRITTEPPGAAVIIDGNRVGATPWEQGERVGTHTVKVELPEHRPEIRTVEVKKDATETVAFTLVRTGGITPPPARPKWPLALAIGGAVVAAGGVALVLLDEDCAVVGPCDAGTDPKVLDSAPLGYGLLAGGVVAAGVGAAIHFLGGSPSRTSATAWVDPARGGGVGVIGRF